MKINILILSLTLLFSQNVFAYGSTIMNGEILTENNYNINTDLQYLTETEENGVIFNGRFDMPFTEEINLRAVAGFGEVDIHAGGYIKWMPIPDFDQQPAMGVLAGLHYADLGKFNEFSIRVHPYISKSLTFDVGSLSPFIALPMALTLVDGETNIPVQLQLGTEVKIRQLKHIAFIAELGIDVDDSFTYFSLGMSFHFDSEQGMVFK